MKTRDRFCRLLLDFAGASGVPILDGYERGEAYRPHRGEALRGDRRSHHASYLKDVDEISSEFPHDGVCGRGVEPGLEDLMHVVPRERLQVGRVRA